MMKTKCLCAVNPRHYSVLLLLLLVYVIIYFISSASKLQPPDGSFVDLSEKHRRELIALYKEQSKDRIEGESFGRLSSETFSQMKPPKKQNVELSVNSKLTGDADHSWRARSELEFDPNTYERGLGEMQDAFQADIGFKFAAKDSSDSDSHRDSFNLAHRYEEGQVVVNLGDMLDLSDKLSNRTIIPPKVVQPYKSWEGAFNIEPYLLSGPVGKIDFECMNILVTPSTPICVYKAEEDVYISAMLRFAGIWEAHIVDQMQRALSRDKKLGLVDLGANIGQYSLIAAKMGHKVLAVEPYMPTLRRFHKAAQMGDVISNLRVMRNAVTDQRTTMYIHVNPDNIGDATVTADSDTCRNCQTVKTILLNDIVPYLNFNRAVVKIDIQGFENRIFYYADDFFNNVYVPYIFMEWALMRTYYVTPEHKSTEKRDVEYTISYLLARNYLPYSSLNGKQLNLEHWEGWPEDIHWILQESGVGQIFHIAPVTHDLLVH